MPLVYISGRLGEHSTKSIPSNLEPRLWLRPNDPHLVEGFGALDDNMVRCDLDVATGRWAAEVWSTGRPDLWYTLVADWLAPGLPSEPTEQRSRGFVEWTRARIYPDRGGEVGDLITQVNGIGLVYCAPDVPDNSKRNQLQLDTDTGWLYERAITWL